MPSPIAHPQWATSFTIMSTAEASKMPETHWAGACSFGDNRGPIDPARRGFGIRYPDRRSWTISQQRDEHSGFWSLGCGECWRACMVETTFGIRALVYYCSGVLRTARDHGLFYHRPWSDDSLAIFVGKVRIPGKNLLRTSLVGRLDKRAALMDTGHGNGVYSPDMFPDARSDEGQTGLSGYPNFSG